MIELAARLADDMLAPAAERVDRARRIPPPHLEALAGAGLFGLAGPVAAGGADVSGPVFRRIVATIAGGCGATFFVWVQHHGVVRLVRSTVGTDDALLRQLCAGDVVAGTAFAHVRRRGKPAVRAKRVSGGWRLDGTAPWVTSWGVAGLFSVAAETSDGQLVWSIVRAGPDDQPVGLAAMPLELPVFSATGTVALDFARMRVSDDDVLLVEDATAWRTTDRVRAAAGQPAPLGIASRVVSHLRALDDATAGAAADALDERVAAMWAADDAMLLRAGGLDAEGAQEFVIDASRHRAELLDVGRLATGAFHAAVGGQAIDLDHPAQRLAREADFYVVQAQTIDGRTAVLERVVEQLGVRS